MIPPGRILDAVSVHPAIAREVLLLVRADRELAELAVEERRLRLLERKVLLALTVVAFAATLVFAATAVIGGAVGGVTATAICASTLIRRSDAGSGSPSRCVASRRPVR